ncbi:MAG: 2-oxo acid dehydrogenase subunit E2 [Actinobacteria bacterium]|nr:2-oxo acid dehydrogenase subunit E2 [Actinomycetota bacterium]MBU1866097.1 2-oxo acid dehydrogenase subunit E2 [Actinomycetota bacterium]
MALEFLLPDVGEGLAEAQVLRWLVPVGGEVGIDQPMVELETDKAILEMPAPQAGVILHHGAAAGETIAVGALLVVIGAPGEEWAPGEAVSPAATAPAEAAPLVGTLEEAGSAGGAQALPGVRKLAAELGVDLGVVAGSGPGGRITRSDVEAAAASDDADVERVPLSATRRAIARNLTRSWQEIPHVTTYGDADATPLLRARSDLAAETRDAAPLECLLISAVIPVLREFPRFNATLQGDDLLLHKRYDIGFAVDTPEGLVVAVLREADRYTPAESARKIVDLAISARDRSIAAADMRGATFTLSNIGAVGGGYGTPIIPYGTTAILSVGRADLQPVVVRNKVVAARRFPLSLSYDHRVIDGASGRRFLGAVAAAIEGFGRG